MLTRPEWIILGGSLALFLAYHAYFLWQIRRRADRTVIGQAKQWRRGWLERMIARQDNIGVIQAFRNWLMSASFLASASLLITAGLLGFLASSDKISQFIHEMNFLGMRTTGAFSIKIILLIANFAISFFNFALAIRFYNYAMLRATGVAPDDSAAAAADAAMHMDKGAGHYALGMRCYYFAIPLVLWLFGPIWLGLGMAILVAALYRHDHPFSQKR